MHEGRIDRRSLLAACLGASLAPSGAWAQSPPAWPGASWEAADPQALGYSRARLEALRAWLRSQNTIGMHVSVGGRTIFEYGEVGRAVKVASVRKSILALLYGRYVVGGQVDPSRTVRQIGLDDTQPFLPIEEHAQLIHLLTARSGIYLPSGNDEQDRQAPRRGSQFPGTYWHYNNWDFNAAGTAFEKLTGRNIYDALASELAQPLGMQDFDRAAQQKLSMMPVSIHPVYHMTLSARDLGRIGLLMLRGGQWNGRQLVPQNWCSYVTALATPFDELNPPTMRLAGSPERWGYGVLWWVWEAQLWPGNISASPFQGAFSAKGAGGQYITVLPARDMVIAHTSYADRAPSGQVSPLEYDAILGMVLAARPG
jgi:CubicO group peptidase (beta-lactamase class C family)